MRGCVEVAIFVTRRGRSEVLVAHRSRSLGGYWHTIAGSVEPAESAVEAARRELREETGLDVAEPALVDAATHAYPLTEEPAERRAQYAAEVVDVRVDCFLVNAPDDWEPTLDWEHDAHRWCGIDEAVALLRWPATGSALRQCLADP